MCREHFIYRDPIIGNPMDGVKQAISIGWRNNMATSKNPPKNQELDRSAVTGRIVTPEYAKSHPKTTVHEKVHNPQRSDPPTRK